LVAQSSHTKPDLGRPSAGLGKTLERWKKYLRVDWSGLAAVDSDELLQFDDCQFQRATLRGSNALAYEFLLQLDQLFGCNQQALVR
jgi:hypothetical protein